MDPSFWISQASPGPGRSAKHGTPAWAVPVPAASAAVAVSTAVAAVRLMRDM